jgi:hypothetical protein
MALNERTIIELVRSRLGIPDASRNAAILWAIPHAIERLARKVAANPRLRPLLLTPQDPITVVNNAIDLAAYNAAATRRILVEYIDFGDVFVENFSSYALQPGDINDFKGAIANHPLGQSYLWYWLDGQTFRIFDVSETEITGVPSKWSVPYVPTLAQLSDIVELHDDLVAKVIEILPEYGGADAAEDDAK